VAAFPGYQLTIDLPRQVVVSPTAAEIPFEVQAFRKYCLVNGFDDIGLTLRHADKIKAFEAERLAQDALAGAQRTLAGAPGCRCPAGLGRPGAEARRQPERELP
jgi:hypothetical protein